jgi:GT2 family glycosyltransferase
LTELDIIIVNYESTSHLLDCLKSIDEHLADVRATIYIEDNASTDGPEQLDAQFPEVHLHCNNTNIGFAAAVNQAICKSSAPFLMLLNPDTIVKPGIFQETLALMQKLSDTAIIGPRILDGNNRLQASARSFPNALTALFGRRSLLSRLWPNNRFTRRNITANAYTGWDPVSVDWVSGACMLVRRAAVGEVGLMDENFFMYWEDADWCRRMRLNGWQVVYDPRVSVVHQTAQSSRKKPVRSAYAFHRSVYHYFIKYDQGKRWYLHPMICMGLLIRFLMVVAIIQIKEALKK